MSDDPRTFARLAAQALRTYADQISTAHWYLPDPENPQYGNVELPIAQGEDIVKSLPVIAGFLETMFEAVEG